MGHWTDDENLLARSKRIGRCNNWSWLVAMMIGTVCQSVSNRGVKALASLRTSLAQGPHVTSTVEICKHAIRLSCTP